VRRGEDHVWGCEAETGKGRGGRVGVNGEPIFGGIARESMGADGRLFIRESGLA